MKLEGLCFFFVIKCISGDRFDPRLGVSYILQDLVCSIFLTFGSEIISNFHPNFFFDP